MGGIYSHQSVSEKRENRKAAAREGDQGTKVPQKPRKNMHQKGGRMEPFSYQLFSCSIQPGFAGHSCWGIQGPKRCVPVTSTRWCPTSERTPGRWTAVPEAEGMGVKHPWSPSPRPCTVSSLALRTRRLSCWPWQHRGTLQVPLEQQPKVQPEQSRSP